MCQGRRHATLTDDAALSGGGLPAGVRYRIQYNAQYRILMRSSQKLLIALASPIVGLFLAEGLVRMTQSEPIPQPVARGSLFRISLKSGVSFENRPGAVRTIEYRESSDSNPRIVEHRVNAQGFRGPLTQPRVLESYRIACLGDSHTFGAGVDEGASWPLVLRELASSDPERFGAKINDVEVLNAGVNAYDTRREVSLLRSRVLDFEPDLVLIQFHVNDVHARNAIGWKEGYDDWLWDLSAPNRDDWVGELRDFSMLADAVLDRIRSSRGVRDESGVSMAGYGENDEGWLSVTSALIEARDLLRDREIEFGVVLFPTLLPYRGALSSHRAFARVVEFCEAESIAVYDAELDLLEAVRTQDQAINKWRVHPHDPHAGPEAHAVFAAGVLSWLRRTLVSAPG